MKNGNKEPKKAAMLKALEERLGIVSHASSETGITRQTHYNWMKSDMEYANAVDELQNVALDFAEEQLMELMRALHPTAIIFYLKTKGKNRGYVERQEITTNQFEKMSDAELDTFIVSKLGGKGC